MIQPGDAQWIEIEALWRTGSPIAAIKRYREITGFGLAQAKSELEARFSPLSALPAPAAALLQSGQASGSFCAAWTNSTGDQCVLLRQSSGAPLAIYVFPWPVGNWSHQLNVVQFDDRQWLAHLESGAAPYGADWSPQTLAMLRQRFAQPVANAPKPSLASNRTSVFRLDQRRFEHWLGLSDRVSGAQWQTLIARGENLDDWPELRNGLSDGTGDVRLSSVDERFCLRLCVHECKVESHAVARCDQYFRDLAASSGAPIAAEFDAAWRLWLGIVDHDARRRSALPAWLALTGKHSPLGLLHSGEVRIVTYARASLEPAIAQRMPDAAADTAAIFALLERAAVLGDYVLGCE